MTIYKIGIFTKFSVFTWRHGGHVGEQNNSQKSLLGIWFYYYAKLAILPLFCTPTWPSHHVSENQEYVWADLLIYLKKIY